MFRSRYGYRGRGDTSLNQVSNPVMVIDTGSLGNFFSPYVLFTFACLCSYLFICLFFLFSSLFAHFPNLCSLMVNSCTAENQKGRTTWGFLEAKTTRQCGEKGRKWTAGRSWLLCSLLFPIPISDFFFIIFLYLPSDFVSWFVFACSTIGIYCGQQLESFPTERRAIVNSTCANLVVPTCVPISAFIVRLDRILIRERLPSFHRPSRTAKLREVLPSICRFGYRLMIS